MKYAEILFLGKCNCSCFYCLQNEMYQLQKDKENQMTVHFLEWNRFNDFINIIKQNNIEKIYLSSVTTEPMMYKYLKELIIYLQEQGLKVGIRTNGYFALEKNNCLELLDEEISFSINSLNNETCRKICNQDTPNWDKVFELMNDMHKKCRVAIVVNRYNYNEIIYMLDFLKKYDCISYVQLRKVYKYYNESTEDILAFEKVANFIKTNCIKVNNYFESDIYRYQTLDVSLWNDVFRKESIQSFNYFTNGDISTHNLLIPAYENKEGCINV